MKKMIWILKKFSYLLSVPVIFSAGVYLMDKEVDIQKEKNDILRSEISFLQKKQESTSYSSVWGELESQKNIYEKKLTKVNNEILNIKEKLIDANEDIVNKDDLLSSLNLLLKEKEIILGKIYYIIFTTTSSDDKSKISKLRDYIYTLKKQNHKKNLEIGEYENKILDLQNTIASIRKEDQKGTTTRPTSPSPKTRRELEEEKEEKYQYIRNLTAKKLFDTYVINIINEIAENPSCGYTLDTNLYHLFELNELAKSNYPSYKNKTKYSLSMYKDTKETLYKIIATIDPLIDDSIKKNGDSYNGYEVSKIRNESITIDVNQRIGTLLKKIGK